MGLKPITFTALCHSLSQNPATLHTHGKEESMNYGFIIPDIQDTSVQALAELAHEAEENGWNGVFFWDADWHFSPWVVMTAMAAATQHARIGAILHPLAWRQPWIFARDAATLDQFSHGRLAISVGMGAVEQADLDRGRTRFGMPTDRVVRAQLIDEALELITGLWIGERYSFHGQHYHIDQFQLTVHPLQQPRIPIWAVGVWGKAKSMARVARCDGMLLSSETTTAEFAAIQAYIRQHRTHITPFDFVMEADTRQLSAAAAHTKAHAWAERGVTWWVESMWSPGVTLAMARERARQGPPG
jgi:alkanesulfonate monooxygenase SsuD/methylene tetrahydromethanopterin reductase-like flavin-dependent oxidoreductase (luciferase family)